MTTEEALLEKWRSLTPDKKQQVFNLVETLCAETVVQAPQAPVATYVPKTELGKQLQAVRARIVAFGEPLLDWEGIEREKAERRGGDQGDDE